MRFLAAASLLALTTTAVAGPPRGDRTPPGLQRVCEQIEPEVTTSEVVSSAVQAVIGPACDHSNYADGRCVVVTRSLAASPTSALGVEVLETTPLVDGTDGPLYVARGFDLDEAADPETQAVTVWANGKPLLENEVLGEPLEIKGFLRYDDRIGKWTHVVVAHGARLTFPVEQDVKTFEDSATLSVSDFEILPSSTVTSIEDVTEYDMMIEKDNGGDTGQPGVIEISIEVTFGEGVYD